MFSPEARRVGDWVVDPVLFQVVRGGEPLLLEPRAVRVLLYLMGRPGQLVTKEELFANVWADTAVTDNALTRVVAQLRKSLGDDAKQPRYIETVPTQGYRFIAAAVPVAEFAGVPAADPPVVPPGEELPPALPKWLLFASGVGLVAITAIVLAGIRGRPDVPPPVPPVQITTSAGLDISPAFSPDGTQIAYASDRSGSFELYVRSISGGRDVQVTSNGGQNIFPTWSPDGQRIAFYSAKAGGIRIVPALGGTVVALTDFGCEPAWSPDGKWIAFRAGGFHSLAPTEANPPLGSTIWVVSPDGGTPRPVTRVDEPEGVHGAPSWSPDGKRILFTATTWLTPSFDQRSTLWTVEANGSGARRLLTRPAGLVRPRFMPGGKRVVALGASVSAVSRKDFDFGVFLYDLESDGPPREIARTGTALPRDLAVSADGKRIAYSVTSFTSNLWGLPMDPRSSLPAGPPVPLVADTSYRNSMPAFSPDGRKVAFHARRRGSLSDIMVYDRESRTTAQITSSPYAEMSASWTPDGNSILYSSGRGEHKQVREFDFTTGLERVRLSDSVPLLGGRLAGDGRNVVYHIASKGKLAVYRQALQGAAPVRMTPEAESIGFPAASRDSHWIAVQIQKGDGQWIGVMPFDGGPLETLVRERGQNWSFSWSPESARIAFAALRDGAWNLWWVTRDGRTQRQLTSNKGLGSFLRYPEWSPRGDMIVYEYAETKGNLFVAELP